jgi:hypothetical protein
MDYLKEPFIILLIISIALLGAALIVVGNKETDASPFYWLPLSLIAGSFVLLALSVLFAVMALPSSTRPKLNAVPEEPIPEGPYSTCLVFSFHEAQHDLAEGDFTAMPQDPSGCVDQLLGWAAKSLPRQLIVTGRTDKQELTPAAARRYFDNTSLAFQRAQTVINRLNQAEGINGRLKPFSIPLTAGPKHLTERDDAVLSRDRSVEIRSYWQRPGIAVKQFSRPEHIGWALNDEALDPGVSLTALSLFVALSAYLAAVGLFMRERTANIGGLIDELDQKISAASEPTKSVLIGQQNELVKRKNRTLTRRKLLVLADSPMIVAALLLGLHVFYFFPPSVLRASVVVVTFSGFSLVLLHFSQWFQTIRHR